MASKKASAAKPTAHGFCTLHRIAYNRDLDHTCPQCLLAHIQPADQLDFDVVEQKPLDASGNLLDARTLQQAT